MVIKKPRIVIIGAGMAGLTAAHKLHTSSQHFELCVVEGGSRIGGRISTSEFNGDRIEMGATWIHGIGGSPVYEIAKEIESLSSDQNWECMDGFLEDPITVAENGVLVGSDMVEAVDALYHNLMDYAQGKKIVSEIAEKARSGNRSVGDFLKKGLEIYSKTMEGNEEEDGEGYNGNWSKRLLREAVFAIHENTQRTYTSAGDLSTLDYDAEAEYRLFPGEEITIAKGYTSVIESLASVLPPGLIQLGKKVSKIDWQMQNCNNGQDCLNPVKLHFEDGSIMNADHVIVTVSLGVLKAGIKQDSDVFKFHPPLPQFKKDAILKLGFGLVNKLFVQLDQETEKSKPQNFPFLQLAFHQSEPESKTNKKKIPWWMRKTYSLSPIYKNSNVLLSWFAGKEALELEKLENEDILKGVSTTISNFLTPTYFPTSPNSQQSSNGNPNSTAISNGSESKFKFKKVLKSQWGMDPLFLGSYSYVAVGSSGDDLDALAEPLPKNGDFQILFAGEATHRTHYSTTHGAYYSGIREAMRLLKHYQFLDV